MNGELVTTSTSDRCRLHGFLMPANGPKNRRFDAAIVTHGLGGNFYSSRFLNRLATTLTEVGIAALLGNTRGHDLLNTTVKGAGTVHLGAAFERVGDCTADINGWVDFLVGRGLERTLIVGHSLGAIKALYSQAHSRHDHVHAICALSATRLNHQQLLNSPEGDRFQQMLQQARDLVDGGQPDALMRVSFPFATWMGAGAYLEKYGTDNHYDWFEFAERISVPTLLVFGERELSQNPAFDGLQEQLEVRLAGWDHFTLEIVAEADHFYSGKSAEACQLLKEWLC